MIKDNSTHKLLMITKHSWSSQHMLKIQTHQKKNLQFHKPNKPIYIMMCDCVVPVSVFTTDNLQLAQTAPVTLAVWCVVASLRAA